MLLAGFTEGLSHEVYEVVVGAVKVFLLRGVVYMIEDQRTHGTVLWPGVVRNRLASERQRMSS